MGTKCIAIGNRIMGDDSIGLKVLENVKAELEKEGLQVIFGETDFEYALSKMENNDFLFILDSTYYNIAPGTVTFTSIEEAIIKHQQPIYSGHQVSLISLLNTYKKSVSGYVIGIEVAEINFSLDLSNRLSEKFSSICKETCKFIVQNKRGI